MPETTAPTLIEELLSALVEAVEAENVEVRELPKPVSVIPFPTVL